MNFLKTYKDMQMNDLIGRDGVMLRLDATTKKEVLLALSAQVATLTGLHERSVFDVMNERENLGSTGVGKGIAVPHARMPGIDRVYAVFAQLSSPVAYDAVDNQPVDLVFMLLSPHDAGADHLQALALVSKTLRNNALCDQLRVAQNAEVVFQLLTQENQALAA